MGGSDLPVSEPLIQEWLDRTVAGPFDGELATFLRETSHGGDKEVTFPGVQLSLPPPTRRLELLLKPYLPSPATPAIA
jgi:hypothetical protein